MNITENLTPKEFVEYLYDTHESEIDRKLDETLEFFALKSGKSVIDIVYENMGAAVIEPNAIEGLEETIFNMDLSRLSLSLLFGLLVSTSHLGSKFPRFKELIEKVEAYLKVAVGAVETKQLLYGLK